jgi:hypothetical protein
MTLRQIGAAQNHKPSKNKKAYETYQNDANHGVGVGWFADVKSGRSRG